MSARNGNSALTEHAVILKWEIDDVVVNVSHFCGIFDVAVIAAVGRKRDIVFYRVGKEEVVLRNMPSMNNVPSGTL